MASRIQGITVEIGGDTTKLSKALESVNKSIKGTQSGLKDVNKLLKLDPSNTELVVQKQKMLKDAIEATKEKLATLKTAAQQANEQLANGEITQQQYDALQREIVETEQNLRSLQDQAATTNATLAKIDEAGEKLQNIGSSVESVGKKFLPVTAAVTGLGTAAVKTAADFESEMSKVSAISGATGDDFDQLRAKAREMGAKTKFSASEAASAMEYMAMAGWKTSDMLNGIEGVMNLAAASGEDLATTSDIVTDAELNKRVILFLSGFRFLLIRHRGVLLFRRFLFRCFPFRLFHNRLFLRFLCTRDRHSLLRVDHIAVIIKYTAAGILIALGFCIRQQTVCAKLGCFILPVLTHTVVAGRQLFVIVVFAIFKWFNVVHPRIYMRNR